MADDSSIAMMQSVTGASSETCSQYLIATNGDIDAAVGLFFAAGDSGAPAPEQPARRPSPRAEDDIGFVTPQTASTLADGGAGGYGGANYAYAEHDPYVHSNVPPAPRQMSLEQQLAMATANMERLQHAGGGSMSALGARGPRSNAGPTNRSAPPASAMDAAFSAPAYGLTGAFREATAHAAREGQWLLVSLTDDSFASGCLNRDVFGNEVVKELLQCSYVLWQARISSEAGSAVADTYGVNRRGLDSPVTLIIHPITRAELGVIKKQQLVSADPAAPLDPMRMQDALLNFADTRPPPVVPGSADDEPPAMAGTSGTHGGVTDAVDPNEDPELAAALAMSSEAHRQETQNNKQQPVDEDVVDVDDDSVRAVSQPLAVAAVEDVDIEADVVDASTEGAMRLRVRLPGGAWNLTLPSTLPFTRLVEGIRTRLRNDGQSDVENMSLQVGFPPKKIFHSELQIDREATLASIGTLRNGDVITPHV